MSERTYFNLRYAVPGYTFVLWNLLINLRYILLFFLTFYPRSSDAVTLLGIFIGFFTLMSGAAIGCLISQTWYPVLYVLRGWLIREQLALLEHHGIGPYRSLTVHHYLLSTPSKDEKEVDNYMTRRWDLASLLGSTFMAILLGLTSGYILRSVLKLPESQQNFVNWALFDLSTLIFSLVLAVVLIYGFYRVIREGISMSDLVIRKRLMCRNLRETLPEEYFTS